MKSSGTNGIIVTVTPTFTRGQCTFSCFYDILKFEFVRAAGTLWPTSPIRPCPHAKRHGLGGKGSQQWVCWQQRGARDAHPHPSATPARGYPCGMRTHGLTQREVAVAAAVSHSLTNLATTHTSPHPNPGPQPQCQPPESRPSSPHPPSSTGT